MRDMRTARWSLAIAATLTGTLIGIAIGVERTGAAYQDSAHGRTENLTVTAAPAFTPGLARNSRMVDTGLGLGNDHNVYMWGRTDLNIGGSVANPGTSRPPSKIPGLPEQGMCQVSGQIYDANALACDGTVWGWGGYNDRNGTDAARPGQNPAQVRIGTAWNGSGPLLDEVLQIATTEYAGAGIRSDGSVWIWGGPTNYGGNGTIRGASQLSGLPDPAIEGNRPVYLSGSYQTFFVILANGDVYFWGGNSSLPSGYPSTSTSAAKLNALQGWFRSSVDGSDPYVIAVEGGINMGGALLSDGHVLSWGNPNRIGGRPTSQTPATSPGLVPGLEDIREMRFGFTGAIFATNSGEIWGYGAPDDYGRFPLNPVLVDSDVVAFAAGQGYYLWQRQDGTFWGRGYNPAGAIGTPIGTVTGNRQISYDMSPVTR